MDIYFDKNNNISLLNIFISFLLTIFPFICYQLLKSLFFIITNNNHNKKLINTNISFPLGSLDDWKDLIEANKKLLKISENNNHKAPISQYTFFKESVAVTKHEDVDKILNNSVSRSLTPAILNFAGLFHIAKFMGKNSVGIAEGKNWHTYRKAIGSSLKPQYIRSLFDEMINCTDMVFKYIENHKKKDDVNFTNIVNSLTFDIVCLTVFKERFGALDSLNDSSYNETIEAFLFAAKEMNRRTSSFNPLDCKKYNFLFYYIIYINLLINKKF